MALSFGMPVNLPTCLNMCNGAILKKVLDRAKLACKSSGYEVIDHFAEVSKIVEAGATSKPIVDSGLPAMPVT